jgi:hypothetical protein
MKEAEALSRTFDLEEIVRWALANRGSCGDTDFFFIHEHSRTYSAIEHGPVAHNIAAVPSARMTVRFRNRR